MRRIELGRDVWGDARGWGMNPWRDSGLEATAGHSCHVVSIEPGAVRGNHLHPDSDEWMVIFGAPCTVAAGLPGDECHHFRYEGGEPAMLHVPAGEAHALRGEGPGTTFLVAFNDRAEPATDRVSPLLESRLPRDPRG